MCFQVVQNYSVMSFWAEFVLDEMFAPVVVTM
jgi:hypothetical protein